MRMAVVVIGLVVHPEWGPDQTPHDSDPTLTLPVLSELFVYRPLVRDLVLKDLKKYRDSTQP
jgi:hypothetical protein